MKPADLKPENVGRKVLIASLNGRTDACATMRAWERNGKTVIVSLDGDYGRLLNAQECLYCSGAGEVAESSSNYMKCPACEGSGRVSRPGKFLRKGTLVEADIEGVRFAPTDRVTPPPGLANK